MIWSGLWVLLSSVVCPQHRVLCNKKVSAGLVAIFLNCERIAPSFDGSTGKHELLEKAMIRHDLNLIAKIVWLSCLSTSVGLLV